MRRYSNFSFALAFLIAPAVIACCIWAYAKGFGSNVALVPMILFALPVQLTTAWAVWRNREELVRISYDPIRRRLSVRHLTGKRSFSCKVGELTVEVGNTVTDIYSFPDSDRHIHRVSCGPQTVLTCRSFSQSRIRSMLREWSSTTGDYQTVDGGRSQNGAASHPEL